MRTWQAILIIITTAVVCSFVGYSCGRKLKYSLLVDEIIYTCDTIRDSIPYPVVETIIQEVPELFPVYITMEGDTIHEPVYVPVTISQKEYQTEDYHAWVSGYKPSLDSIWVYPEKIIIKEKPRRWGIGVIAGYGIGRNGLSPYVGVGGYWKVW